MKICFIADTKSIHIMNWLKYFVAQNHKVYLITDTENQIEGVTIFNIGDCLPKPRIPLLTASIQISSKIKKIKSLLSKIKPQIIHSHYATNYGYLAAKANFHPLVLTCHGSDILLDLGKDKVKHHFVKFALNNSDLITMPSNQMAQIVKNETNGKKQMSILQYGIDTEQFNFQSHESDLSITFISTRALLPKYRIDLLIQAFAMLKEEYSDVKLLIAGTGFQEASLKKLMEELNMSSSIEFTGDIQNNEIHKLYKNAQFYVTTSPTDGLSISLLEAMSCGCYPILPDNESNIEVEKLGFQIELYRNSEVESLFYKMKRAVEKKDTLTYIVQNNSKLVDENFSRKRNLAKVEKIYHKLSGGY